MVKYIIRRIVIMIPVLIGVLFIVFTLNQLMPGDPVINMIGTRFTPEQYAAAAHTLGLDQPFFVRFWNYIVGVVTHFDLGTSYQTHRSVSAMIIERIPVTLKLGIYSSIFTFVLGVPLGIVSAIKQYSVIDFSVTTISMVLAAMPGFWLAMLLMLSLSLSLELLPSSGIGTWQHWVMPILAQGLMPIAIVARMTRSSMLEVVRQDYIVMAFAKGLSERAVILRHELKNALIPIITVFGMQMSMIFGGSVVIEMIFSMPGMGTLLMAAINNRDYPTIMGVVFMISLCVCIINLLVDPAYAAADPRIKAQFTGGLQRKRKDDSVAEALEEDAEAGGAVA